MTDYIPDWLQDFISDTGAIITNYSEDYSDIGYSIPNLDYGGENGSGQGEQGN